MATELKQQAPRLQALLEQTLIRSRDPVHEDSYLLRISTQTCGNVFLPAVQVLRDLPDVVVDDQTRTVCVQPAQSPDATLARIATTLREAGCVPYWRDELLDVLSDQDLCVGAIERGLARCLGILTKAVHLNAWSQDGGLWVARRSLTKPTDPGKWDTLVGGLIATQESAAFALERESLEEAGLTPEQLTQCSQIRDITLMRRRLPEGYQRELVLSANCILGSHVRPVNQDGESMTIECYSPAEIIDMLEDGLFTVAASLIMLEDLVFQSTGERIKLPLS